MLKLERLIQNELFIQCPLVTSGAFIKFCKERDLSVNEKDLELYEKLGIFYPIARVEFPKYKEKIEYIEGLNSYRMLGVLQDGEVWDGKTREDYGHFRWAKDIAEEFNEEGLLWWPRDKPFTAWDNFYDKHLMHRKIESYYSIFQIYPLYMLKQSLSRNLSLSWWSTYDDVTINKLVDEIKNISKETVTMLSGRENISDEIADLCQTISNRYFPKTQSDRRTINISSPSHYDNWSWKDFCRKWNAKLELSKMGIEEEKVKEYQEIMSLRARNCDPLKDWYDLVQFVSLAEKQRLKGPALLAQTLYSMEMMLRLFYQELTGQDLAEQYSMDPHWKEHVYGKGVPESNMAFLEFLTTKYHLNPRPKLILIVEGQSEYKQFPRIAEAVGRSFDILGIRIELLGSTGDFTSKKSEKLTRFIDHYHHMQTIVYIILDNENNTPRKRERYLTERSRYEVAKYITRDDYIFLWDTCFEYDNFSDAEIAQALSLLMDGYSFSEQDVAACRVSKQKRTIAGLFKDKTGRALSKPSLAEKLVDNVISNLKNEFINGEPKRKLLKKILEIADLARRNHQPWSYGQWRKNQESGHFGGKAE